MLQHEVGVARMAGRRLVDEKRVEEQGAAGPQSVDQARDQCAVEKIGVEDRVEAVARQGEGRVVGNERPYRELLGARD